MPDADHTETAPVQNPGYEITRCLVTAHLGQHFKRRSVAELLVLAGRYEAEGNEAGLRIVAGALRCFGYRHDLS